VRIGIKLEWDLDGTFFLLSFRWSWIWYLGINTTVLVIGIVYTLEFVDQKFEKYYVVHSL